MDKAIRLSRWVALALSLAAFSVYADDITPQPTAYYDYGGYYAGDESSLSVNNAAPSMEPYRYTPPANSWYMAKIKPKWQKRAKAKAAARTAPANSSESSKTAYTADSESINALPFWNDIPARH